LTIRPCLRRIPLVFFALWGIASLSGVEVAPDRRKVEPLALLTGEPAMVAAQAKAMGTQGRQTADFGVFVHLTSGNRAFPDKIRALGGEAAQIHDRLYSGILPADATRYVSLWPEVAYIEAAKMARPMLDVSRPAVQADVVQAGTGLPSAYSGDGTYVGIVDSGLSSGHLDFFINGNPSSPRVAPNHWYPNQSIAGTDTEWHGTHVAGIAAGNGFLSGGRFIGMAPGASLLVAKTTFTTVDIQTSVTNLLNFAGTTPAAINLSLGVTTGPHDGTSLFEEAINSLATNGVAPGQKQIITAAAGNERMDGEHILVALPPFGSRNIPLSLETGGSYIDAWADEADRYTVRATLGSETAVAASGTSAFSSAGRISISNRTDTPPNGATHITVFFTASSTSSATVFLERTRNGGNGKMDAYIDKQDGSFTTATEGGTITEPANAQNVIAVGSFDTKTTGGSPDPTQGISSFSSLGPTRDGRDKPDLAAPGAVLYSAKSLDSYLGPHPTPSTVPGYDNYVILEGTSMSAPHVAGIASLIWQSNPLLTSAQMRERLRRTATPVPPSPNPTWGFGKANALRAVSASVASITAPATASPGNSVNLTSDSSSGAFGNPLSYAWAFSSRPTGSAASLSSPTDASTSFVPDIPGDYRVSLTVSQVSPAGTAPGTAEATVHVNNIPIAAIAGPATDNVGIPVSFSGAGSTDPDSQPLTLRWVLVSRPSGSQASLLPTGSDNATMTPDFPGTYEVGLRADDGLDNSALVTKTLTSTGVAPSSTGGGGGGGCSIGNGTRTGDVPSSLAALLLILLPLFVLPARKRGRSTSRCPGPRGDSAALRPWAPGDAPGNRCRI
jgi:subtilisin family serine protease